MYVHCFKSGRMDQIKHKETTAIHGTYAVAKMNDDFRLCGSRLENQLLMRKFKHCT